MKFLSRESMVCGKMM